jgi:hypothetical protein
LLAPDGRGDSGAGGASPGERSKHCPPCRRHGAIQFGLVSGAAIRKRGQRMLLSFGGESEASAPCLGNIVENRTEVVTGKMRDLRGKPRTCRLSMGRQTRRPSR